MTNLQLDLYGMTTLVQNKFGAKESRGTGVFYAESTAVAEGSAQHNLDELWLVSNRHVLCAEGNNVPDETKFSLRQDSEKEQHVLWSEVSISRAEFVKRIRLHPNPDIDVALLRVGDIVQEHMYKIAPPEFQDGEESVPMSFFMSPITKLDLPEIKEAVVEVADDVIIIGYPRGFYDSVNLYPIVKSGMIASAWGLHFDGAPYFLVDAKLFPGSSGSVVLSKPSHNRITKGGIGQTLQKTFSFLGIYSAELNSVRNEIEVGGSVVQRMESFELGVVWYGSLIEEIIGNGIGLNA